MFFCKENVCLMEEISWWLRCSLLIKLDLTLLCVNKKKILSTNVITVKTFLQLMNAQWKTPVMGNIIVEFVSDS